MHYYKLSLKKQSYPRFISYLEEYLQHFREKYPKVLVREFYEHDPHGIIHFHALLTTKRKLYIRDLRSMLRDPKEYNINFSLIEDQAELRNWEHYIIKNKRKETDAINSEHAIEHNYIQLMQSMSRVSDSSEPIEDSLDEPDARIFEVNLFTGQPIKRTK